VFGDCVVAHRYLAPVALRGKPARLIGLAAAAALAAAALVAFLVTRGGDAKPSGGRVSAAIESDSSSQPRDSEAAQSYPEPASSTPGQVAEDPAAAAASASPSDDTGPSPGAPSDAQVRKELRQLQRYQRQAKRGGSIGLSAGEAEAPPGSPSAVQDMVAGGNAIATFPYRLGGGHGSFVDDAYDCSGSVSYALAAAGLLDVPLTSGDLMKWGAKGPGRWMTVYANPGHVFMTVGGVRFDTSGRDGRRGSRWQALNRSAGGFVARHWPGL
jgi:cell wall-associated NlpC family hydrolase